MSIGSTGPIGSFAASIQQQAKAGDQERVAQDADNRNAQSTTSAKSEADAEVNENASTHDRDADGRRLWTRSDQGGEEDHESEEGTQTEQTETHQSKDATGDRGQRLDLSG